MTHVTPAAVMTKAASGGQSAAHDKVINAAAVDADDADARTNVDSACSSGQRGQSRAAHTGSGLAAVVDGLDDARHSPEMVAAELEECVVEAANVKGRRCDAMDAHCQRCILPLAFAAIGAGLD